MGMLLVKWISRLEYLKYPRYCGLQERRQFVCFLFTSLVELLYIPANLMGLNGYHRNLYFDIYNWMHLVLVFILQVLFWKNKISTRAALYIFFIGIVFKLSTESLYQAFLHESVKGHVFGNFNIIMIMAAVALACKLNRLAVILTMMLSIDLAVCFSIGPTKYMVEGMRVFFVGYALIAFVLLFNTKNIGRGLRQPHEVDEEERKALEMLINLNESEREKALSLMDRLSDEQKEKIRQNVMDHFRDREFEEMAYEQLCPELTKSEIEICKLVLQGKTLKEMCDVLGKTESNITSQRSHIRKKLQMQSKEDLRSTLELRMHEIRERQEYKRKEEDASKSKENASSMSKT